jgi:hypothetical protein
MIIYYKKKIQYEKFLFFTLRPAELESTQIVWKTKGLPLTTFPYKI